MAEAPGSLFARPLGELAMGDGFRTRGRTVTEADVVNFAGFSGDWNPHHVDAAFAATTQFGERIAHGMGVLSIAMALVPFDAGVVLALTGLDAVRFRRPVFLGSTIHVTGQVAEVRERDEASGHVTLAFDVVTERDVRACSARAELLWAR